MFCTVPPTLAVPSLAPGAVSTGKMFVQTSHVETMLALDRIRGARS